MIAVLKYDRESARELTKSFESLGISDDVVFTDCEDKICSAEKIILPDTSDIKLTLRWMQFHNFYNLFRMFNKPILGIDAGAAMMCDSISNITALSLGFFPLAVNCPDDLTDTFHSTLNIVSDTILLDKIESQDSFHFENKCEIEGNQHTTSKINYEGKEFSATIEKSNYYGIMFNPSKSGEEGLKVLNNFINL